jgi:hypothetical protein
VPQSFNVAVSEDSFVKDGSSTIRGTLTKLETDQSPQTEAFLKFNVSQISTTVQSAKVRIYVVNSSSNGPKIKQVGNSWSEGSLVYSNRPSAISSTLDNKSSMSAGKYVDYDVTAVVKNNGTYSFAFIPESSDGMDFYSKEASSVYRPILIITQTTAGSTP